MITLDNLSIRGFLSIASMDINLNQKGITLIKGPNGVGKSNLLSSIVWAIYGKNLKGVSEVNTWKKLRSDDYAGTMVSLYWRNNGSVYQVIRCQNYKEVVHGAKGSNRLIFLKDAVIIEDKKKADIQSQINKAIGISYNLFMSSVMFGQGLKRLLQENSSDQKAVFEEIFELNYISEARDISKARYQDMEERLREAQSNKSKTESLLGMAKSNLESSVKSAKDFNKNISSKLKVLHKDLDQSTKALILLEPNEQRKTILDHKKKDLRAKLEEVQEMIDGLNEKIGDFDLRGALNNIKKLLEAKKIKTAIKELSKMELTFVSLDVSRTMERDYKEELSKISEESSEYQLQKSKYNSKQNEINQIKRYISQLENTEAPIIDKTLKSKITKLTEELEVQKSTCENYKNQCDTLKWVYQVPLGPNGLKAYIFDNSLGELNALLEEYSAVTGINITLIIDTSTIRKDFDVAISLDGTSVLYEELSGGQKQLVNLTMALAMSELANTSKEINITFLDEVFESLSYDNIEVVLALLKKMFKEKPLFLITHHDSLPVGNTRTIEVSKTKGISGYNF